MATRMTKEAERLEKDLRESKDLQAKWEEALKAAIESGAESDVAAMEQAAKTLGYSVSTADMEKTQAEAQALSDDDLVLAAGGVSGDEDEYGHDARCWTAWHCHAVTLHTETKSKDVACWSDYLCATRNFNLSEAQLSH